MLIIEALFRSLKDIYLTFYHLLTRPNKLEAELGQVKAVLSFLIATFLMIGIFIFPYFIDQHAIQDANMIFLNILQTPQNAQNTSYLCKFRLNSLEATILNYTISNDSRQIDIFTNKGDFKIESCKKHPPGYLFNDLDIQGTLIHIFYSGTVNTTKKPTADEHEITKVSSDSPLKIFIRNKNAVLIHQTGKSSSLVRLARTDHHMLEHYSLAKNYLEYSRQFIFRNRDGIPEEKTVKRPRVYFYQLPDMNKVEVTRSAQFENGKHFTVSFEMPDVKGDESFKTFVEVQGQVIRADTLLPGQENMTFSFIDYVDTDEVNNYRKTLNICKVFLTAIAALLTCFFLVNVYVLSGGASNIRKIFSREHHTSKEVGLDEQPQQAEKQKVE